MRDQIREPVSFIHDTEDGPIHLLTLPDKDGGWKALHWGTTLSGGRHFRTMVKANVHLLQSFAELFPDHVCTLRCGTAEKVAQLRAAADMNFWDHSTK